MYFLGTKYGGWYVPENMELNENSVVYSAGAGEDISFDLRLQCLTNASIFLIDPTSRATEHYKSILDFYNKGSSIKGNIQPDYLDQISFLQPNIDKIHYIEKGVWKNKDKLKFFKQTNESYVSQSLITNMFGSDYDTVDVLSIKDIMTENNHTYIDMLKIDIEGAEIVVLDQMLDDNIFPKYILVEFDLYLKGKDQYKDTEKIVKRLNNHNYCILKNDNMNVTFMRL